MIPQHIGATCPNFLHEWISFKSSQGKSFTSYDQLLDLLVVFNFQYFKTYCK